MASNDTFSDDFDGNLDDFGGWDMSDVPAEDLKGGGTVNREGWYHFEVVEVKPELATQVKGQEASPHLVFVLEVQRTVEGQSPKKSRLYHRVYLASKGGKSPAEGSKKSALTFGVGLGLWEVVEEDGKEIIIDTVTRKTQFKPARFLDAKGKQCIAKVVFNEGEVDPNTKKKKFPDKYELPFGRVYQLDDDYVSEVPIDEEVAAMVGFKKGVGFAGRPKTPPTDPMKGTSSDGPKPGGKDEKKQMSEDDLDV